eukprot:scaffold124011_cov19-Tisochrysis_lutea.AAC.1
MNNGIGALPSTNQGVAEVNPVTQSQQQQPPPRSVPLIPRQVFQNSVSGPTAPPLPQAHQHTRQGHELQGPTAGIQLHSQAQDHMAWHQQHLVQQARIEQGGSCVHGDLGSAGLASGASDRRDGCHRIGVLLEPGSIRSFSMQQQQRQQQLPHPQQAAFAPDPRPGHGVAGAGAGAQQQNLHPSLHPSLPFHQP